MQPAVRRPYCFASWHITDICNFKCEYCSYGKSSYRKSLRQAHTKLRDRFSSGSQYVPKDELDRVIQTFSATGAAMTFGFTGGEPFVVEGFNELLQRLMEVPHFAVAIDTNLSASIQSFMKHVPPGRVEYIFASMHIQERERFSNGVDRFIERAKILQENGYHLIVNYVLYPPLIERFLDDFEYAKSKGVHLAPKPFKGRYRGQLYPDAYTEQQRQVFKRLDPSMNIRAETVPNYRGRICNDGKSLIRIDPNGDVTRCKTDRQLLGSIYTGIQLFDELQPCRVNRCPCFGPERLFQVQPVCDRLMSHS